MAAILVVDDEAPIRQLLVRWIQGAGHQAIEAESAEAALLEMQRREAAVVFTDIHMPGHDGRWLTAELRTRHPQTAVVLATARDDIEPQVSLQFGVMAYLVKPFTQAAVLAALASALAWREDAARSPHAQTVDEDELKRWLDSLD
jgi:DNA-binding NtrC family response regulator